VWPVGTGPLLRLTGNAETLNADLLHIGENDMARLLASVFVATSLLAVASSEASAWVCLAAGFGSSAYGRDYYNVVDAKLMALRGCERRSPIPICTIVWCRPGWR
jgi:hypothetical protein